MPYGTPGRIRTCTLRFRRPTRWTVAQTWTTVVLGTALVLGWLAWFDWQAALLALLFFAVGGLPIVIRSLVLDFRERERIQRGRGQ